MNTTTTTATTATATKSKQNMIAVSSQVKTWVKDTTCDFTALNKGGNMQNASEREILDAMVQFIDSTRYQEREETNESGDVSIVEVDTFGESVMSVLDARLDYVRPNTSASKVKSLESALMDSQTKLAELMAKLEKLGIA